MSDPIPAAAMIDVKPTSPDLRAGPGVLGLDGTVAGAFVRAGYSFMHWGGEPSVRKLVRRVGWPQLLALLFIVLGSVLIPIIGWLIGIVLLWMSDRWSVRDKIMGTLIWPGGLGGIGILGLEVIQSKDGSCGGSAGMPLHCTSHNAQGFSDVLIIPLVILLIALPLLIAWHLLRNAQRAI
jgi:hypothetical protein